MQGKNPLKLIIFDLDGTLVNLPVRWGILKERLRRLLRTEEPLTPLLPSIERIVGRNIELRTQAWKLIEDEEMNAVLRMETDIEIIRVFEKLKNRGFKIALMTLQGRKPAEEALKRLRIQGFFDDIVSREDAISREEQITELLDRFNLKPSEVIVVGDRLNDMLAATRLGCKTIAVSKKTYISGNYKCENVKQILEVI